MSPENFSLMPYTSGDRSTVESPSAARLERLQREAEEETEDARDYWAPRFRPEGGSLSGDGETADDRNA